MQTFSFSDLNEFTGTVGVGSVALLSLFLVLDALTPVFALVEAHAESQSWAIFAVVPLLVFSYVAGIICIAVGNILRKAKFYGRQPVIDWRDVDEKLINIMTLEFRQFARKLDILDGSIVAFLLLAVGVAFESIAFGFPVLGAILGVTCIFASIICAALAVGTERQFNALIERSQKRK